MDEATIFGRGISFPPRLGPDGRLAWSVGPQNIREAIRVILLTVPGERLMLAGFGGKLRRFLYEPNTVATRREIQDEIVRALSQWEPRISLDAVTVEADPLEDRAAVATINYRLVASQATDQISVRVALGG
jgi:phage baseplate assembly protein W